MVKLKSSVNPIVFKFVHLRYMPDDQNKGATIRHFRTYFLFFTALITANFILSGCTTTLQDRANLKQLYDNSAQYHQPDRNPVIVIPGILGSRLVDDDTGITVWGAFRADYAEPSTKEGARLIALPLVDGPVKAPQKQTNIRPDGVLENLEVKLAGIPISIQAYAGILNTLGAGGYRDESLGLNSINYGTDHFTCFQFDYDWRQDIPTNAARLKAFIDDKRLYVQERYARDYGIKDADVQFDIVAHSMGAVLSRYFARFGGTNLQSHGEMPVTWAGTGDIDRLIMVAPPNAGSLEAMDQLINGFNTGRPVLPFYHQALIGTFPSVYQLLPRGRHGAAIWQDDQSKQIDDLLDPKLWKDMKWGLSGENEDTDDVLKRIMPDIETNQERRTIARKFQRQALERAKIFQKAMDTPARPPNGFEMFLVAGDNQRTPSVASIDKATGDFSIFKYRLGDKTVLRSSALMDERLAQTWEPTLVSPISWSSTMFIPGKHRTITNGPIFENNVLFWLLEEPRR